MRQDINFSHASQRDVPNRSLAEVQGQINISFEFFPPHTSEMEQTLWNSIDRFSSPKPEFVSVIYGVNSGERDHTHGAIKGIKNRTGPEAVPRLICIDATPAELQIIARDYWNNGIRHIAALCSDPPPGSGKPETYTSDLVTLSKEVADFDTSVAVYPEVYPEAKSAQADLLNLRREVDAGVNRVTTQLFSDVESYLRFHDRCVPVGADMEVVLGILSVSNFKQAKKFIDVTDMRTPAWMAQMFDGLDDDVEVRKLMGTNIAMDMVKILSYEEVKGFRFYTLDHAEISYVTCHILGARPGS